MSLLKHYYTDCLGDPTKLQEFVWFNLYYHFGRRGREGWTALQKEHFKITVDTEGNRYVGMVYLTESTKNNPGDHKQSCQDYSDVRMYEVVTNPMDLVKAFEFHLTKLHPENEEKVFSRNDFGLQRK